MPRLLPLLLSLLLAAPVMAQELRGTVFAEDSIPAPGVIVEGQDSNGARVASALTDARGYFILKFAAPGTYTLRGLKIGRRPSVFGSYTLAAGEVKTERFELSGAVVSLERVQVVGRSVCGSRRASDAQVVALLDEARKAIRATQLRSNDGDLTATWSLSRRVVSLDGAALTDPVEQIFQGSTTRPFQSAPPGQLAALGYMTAAEDGLTFYAPDAQVLLSEQFVESHCFRTEPWRGDARDWVGIGFTPANSDRDVVGIEGTLWLNRQTAELQYLEYRYVKLPAELRTQRAGGRVAFQRLPSGAWLVNAWEIRMPRVTQAVVSQRVGRTSIPRTVTRVTSLEVNGGAVREIRRGDSLLYVDTTVARAAPLRTAADVAQACPAPLSSDEAVLWGRVRRSAGAAVANAVVELAWHTPFRVFGDVTVGGAPVRMEARADADGQWTACGVPRDALVTLSARDGAARSLESRVWLPPDSLGTEVSVRMAAPTEAVTGTVFGRVTDSLRAEGRGIAADIWVQRGWQRARSDASGAVSFDGLGPGGYELMLWDDTLAALFIPPLRTLVAVDAEGSAMPARLSVPSLAALYAARCTGALEPGTGMLVGELRDIDGTPRAGVKVRARWERSLVRAGASEVDQRSVETTSDSRGRFALCGLPRSGDASRSGDVVVFSTGEFELSAEGSAVTASLQGDAIRRRDLVVAVGNERRRIGSVVKDALGRPIADAIVSIRGLDSLTARTGADGTWSLVAVPTQSLELQVRALRYLPRTVALDPWNGEMRVGELRLESAPQQLETVTIRGIATNTSAAGFEDRKRTYGFGTFLDEATLRVQPTVTAQFLANRVGRARADRGFVLEKAGSGFAAFTTCEPRWFVDAVDFGRLPEAEQRVLLIQAKRIEVYQASLAPPQFNDFDGCGVVVIWTR